MKRLPNPSLDVSVDPILAAIAGAVILFGGGAAAYGATRDTEPRTPAPATAQAADPVVARALKIVSRTDGTVPAADASAAADEVRAAKLASAKGRSVDPFPTVKDATTASAQGGSSSGTATDAASASTGASGSAAAASPASASVAASAKAQATAAAKTSDAANAAVQAATGGSTNATPAKSTPTTATGGGSSTDSAAVARRLTASKPAKVSLRVVALQRRMTMNQRPLGLLVPSTTTSVARVVRVSASNRVVVLRLREGAALSGKQSVGTRCIERRAGSTACKLVSVHTGRTAVIRAPKTRAGRNGAVTALRVLSVWRGGSKVAE